MVQGKKKKKKPAKKGFRDSRKESHLSARTHPRGKGQAITEPRGDTFFAERSELFGHRKPKGNTSVCGGWL